MLSYLFCIHKFHIIENYFIFELLKKKIWANFQRIIELFTQKIVTKLLKLWVWDPRSGIRKKPIPDSGSRGQKSTGSRIRNTARNKAFYREKFFVSLTELLIPGGRRVEQRPQQRRRYGRRHGPACPRRHIPHPHCVGRESGHPPAARCQHQSPASRRQIPGESPFFLLCSRSGYVIVHLVFFWIWLIPDL